MTLSPGDIAATRSILAALPAALLTVLGVSACSSPLPSPSRVRGLRLLTIVSEPTQPSASNDRVTLRAITVDGADQPARTRSLRWFFCDESHTADPVGCARTPATAASSTDGDTLTVGPGALGSTGVRTVLLALCPGAAATYNTAGAILDCPDERGRAWSDTEGTLAFYTVRRAPEGVAINRAPVIESVSVQGDPREALAVDHCVGDPCPSLEWIVQPAAESAEPVGDDREALTASYFATDGAFDRPRSITTPPSDGRDRSLRALWTAPRTAGTVRAWVVLRDDRGASAVVERVITVR